MKKKLLGLVGILSMSAALSACSAQKETTAQSTEAASTKAVTDASVSSGAESTETKTDTAEKKTLKIASVGFNFDELNSPVALDMLKAKGYEVEVITLEDATTMNEAAMNGEIDASLHQHKPWMDAYNESKGRNMVMIEPYVHYNVFGMYSDKYDTVEEIPDNAKVCIPEDSSNTARALRLLEQQKLVTLPADVAIPTVLDIQDNYKNLQFTTVNTAQVIKALPDVDICLVAKMFQVSNNVDPETEIVTSEDLYDYGVGFVVAPENADAQWAKDLAEVYTSSEMKEEIKTIFKGCYVPKEE